MMRSICCWAILLIAVPGAMHAQSTDTVRAPLSFRRAYVPESELLERVKQGQRYVPMDTADFEARLRRIQNNRPAAHELLALSRTDQLFSEPSAVAPGQP